MKGATIALPKRFRKKPTKKTVAKKTIRKKYITAVGNEWKYVDFSVIANIGNNAEQIFTLNLVSAGTGESQRIGEKQFNKTLFIRYNINTRAGSALAGPSSGAVRIVIFTDTMCNGALPPALSYFENAVNTYISPQNINTQKERYFTLYDRVHDYSALGDTASITQKVYKKLNFATLYKGATSNIIDCQKYPIYFLVLAECSTAQAIDLQLRISSRIRYTDN